MKTQLDMKEINKIPKMDYSVVSLFSGCGGSSLGYKLAGFDVKLASEFIPKAIEVYKLNHPNTIVSEKDIRDTTGEEILNLIGLEKYELDILDGSPPCSDFSVCGKREQGWGKTKTYSSTKQRVDDLFLQYARMVREIKPRVFIAENVKGLTLGKARLLLSQIIHILTYNIDAEDWWSEEEFNKELEETKNGKYNNLAKDKIDMGYDVEFKVLDASRYGVPQKRERTIIIGIRKDLDKKPTFPIPNDCIISTKDAIEDLLEEGTDKILDKRRSELLKYFPPLCSSKEVKQIKEENNLKMLEQEFRRDKWEEPYYTIRQHKDRPIHPIKDRLLSINEAKRLQTFPDDFILPHSNGQNWERIGRAVPPNLMKAVAIHIRENVLKNKQNSVDKIKKDDRIII